MMHFDLFIAGEGHHIAAWRDPSAPALASQDIDHYIELARKGEGALFDFLFTADTNAVFYGDEIAQWCQTTQALRLEPLTLLSALAVATTRIGLICTATTTYLEGCESRMAVMSAAWFVEFRQRLPWLLHVD